MLMSKTWRKFSKYSVVGVLNTLIHFLVFYFLVFFLSLSQAASNLIAFSIACSFGFVANTFFTFSKRFEVKKYFYYLIFMGGLSYIVGLLSQHLSLSPWGTPFAFSFVSWILGFLISKKILDP